VVGKPQVSFKPNNIYRLLRQTNKRTGGWGFCLVVFCN